MDPLTAVLAGPRARDAFLLQALMSPPWSLRVEDEAPLTVVVVQRGSAWFTRAGTSLELHPGDALLIRGPEPYLVTDKAGTPPTAVIRPGQRCSGPGGEDLTDRLDSELRTWGNDVDGPDALLIGTYLTASEVGRALLTSLPMHYLLRNHRQLEPIIGLILDELAQSAPARTTALDRLLDLLLVRIVRQAQADLPAHANWLSAQNDPVIHRALTAIHRRPAEAWTVEKLARVGGTSRANFARRFSEQVGQSPMAYLSQHRLSLAADLLLGDGRLTTAAVAARTGYATPYSFSHAFKAHHGVSPQIYRRGAGTVGQEAAGTSSVEGARATEGVTAVEGG
ncbi:AraC family transcriptional regulator [Arthrobacter crystallopoietes]|uniref:AraC family transcriptional regulator n=1 Tax=Crystallibacter crystallopoietes TaxID=37928 RepID=UPI003D1A1A1A